MTPKKRAHLARLATSGRAGRKPKFSVGDPVRVTNGAPAAYRGRVGTIVGTTMSRRSCYRVAFAGGEAVSLYSWWLEAD